MILEIELDIGLQAGIVMESLDFAIESAKVGTMLENSRWVINKIPALSRCSSCRQEYEPLDWLSPCPYCQNHLSEVLQGRELRVKSLQVE